MPQQSQRAARNGPSIGAGKNCAAVTLMGTYQSVCLPRAAERTPGTRPLLHNLRSHVRCIPNRSAAWMIG